MNIPPKLADKGQMSANFAGIEPMSFESSGFVGRMKSLGMLDIINFYCITGKSAYLFVQNNKEVGWGELTVKDGNLIHASTQTNKGEEAFYEMMFWNSGEFTEMEPLQTTSPNINTSWQNLMLQAAQYIDESNGSSRSVFSPAAGVEDDPNLPPFETIDTGDHNIYFHLKSGKKWVFPNTRIQWIELINPKEMQINLTSHQLTLKGAELDTLCQLFYNRTVSVVREIPPRARSGAIVNQIDVRPIQGTKSDFR